MGLIARFGAETLGLVLEAAPYVLLGLLIAGLLRTLIPDDLVVRWMGHRGLVGALRAALLGVPLPICSCGVVPIAAELRKKGASRPATLGFLITTPESSLDSILLTWGLMGPLMAVARPVAALLTSLLAGVLQIAVEENGATAEESGETADEEPSTSCCEAGCCEPEIGSVVERGARERLIGLRDWWRQGPWRIFSSQSDEPVGVCDEVGQPAGDATVETGGPWRLLLRPALRYGFVDLADQLVFWLALGLLAAGLVAALVPGDLAERGLGSGIMPMLLMVVAGVPLYMCASASTPVAAALLVKGLSPGAALVLLLTGPATNVASLVLLRPLFGRRFVACYLIAVVVAAVGCGLMLDAVLLWTGATIMAATFEGSDISILARPVQWVCATALVLLCGWRLVSGAWRAGVADLRGGMRPFVGLARWCRRSVSGRPMTLTVMLGVAVAWLLSGLVAVPLGSLGFEIIFGSARGELGPGLHWSPAWPVGEVEVRPVARSRKADVGFLAAPELLSRRRELRMGSDPGQWHSPVTAMNADPIVTSYLTGDENLVSLAYSVHYRIREPKRFFYEVDQGHPMVGVYAQAVAREIVAGARVDALLSELRRPLEQQMRQRLQDRVDQVSLGVEITEVLIVDVHPPQPAVFAFRDVSSAREDRETMVHKANETLEYVIPRARGEAALTHANAQAEAERATLIAEARADAFTAREEAVGRLPEALRHLLRLETLERAFASRDKLILPSGAQTPAIAIWQPLPAPVLESEVAQ